MFWSVQSDPALGLGSGGGGFRMNAMSKTMSSKTVGKRRSVSTVANERGGVSVTVSVSVAKMTALEVTAVAEMTEAVMRSSQTVGTVSVTTMAISVSVGERRGQVVTTVSTMVS